MKDNDSVYGITTKASTEREGKRLGKSCQICCARVPSLTRENLLTKYLAEGACPSQGADRYEIGTRLGIVVPLKVNGTPASERRMPCHPSPLRAACLRDYPCIR